MTRDPERQPVRDAINRAFGDELRFRRRNAGLTIVETMTALDWKRGTYLRSEGGRRDLTPTEIFQIAALFEIEPEEFVDAAMRRVTIETVGGRG
ncbi:MULTISPECIES: helix-turn-helix domain-containing protein [unclassified Nocardia]|uniref:helix-turn-helix domain-containing protein n=1 Tax=unclassified Nocardia TaxID=2637762 RepID=UPI00278C2954|nr:MULTISPECIES: helix-turn-helix transcriptional regulator [unclassified Nocardia]